MAAKKLTKEKRWELARTFVELDENGDGVLSREEVGTWIRSEGYNLTNQEIEKVFRKMDENADGRISLDEFLDFNAELLAYSRSPKPTNTRSHSLPAEVSEVGRLVEIFSEMALPQEGRLSKEQALRGLIAAGHDVSERELPNLLRNLGTTNDGMVNYREFLNNCKSLIRQTSEKKSAKKE